MITYKLFLEHVIRDDNFWGKEATGCIPFSRTTKRFLFGFRSSKVRPPNLWGTFGGALDDNETLESNTWKELYEETRYEEQFSDRLIKLDVFQKQLSDGTVFKYHNYIAVIENEFIPRLNWENSRFMWVNYRNWPSPLIGGLEDILFKGDSKIRGLLN